MKVLVIGASGFLGRHIYKHFKAAGNLVTGTYCSNQADSSMVRFDLNRDDLESIDDFSEETDKCAILCAAETRLDACENEREKSFQINVASTIKLIEQLKKRNYYIIFCSTESVYDGKKGNYTENDVADAINEYGKMKLQIEKYLMDTCSKGCVFRIGRVVGDTEWPRDILYGWKKMAVEGKDICCIRGNYFSPVDVADVVNCLEIACKKKVQGIYNICGDKIYSRSELCCDFLHSLGLQANIYEKNLAEFHFNAARPLNIGMKNGKAVKDLEYKFNIMEEVYARYEQV